MHQIRPPIMTTQGAYTGNGREPDPPVVLGGGLAGIAAAVTLAKAGLRPILIESRPYLGGRARSFIHRDTGDEIDNGQHLMMGCYHATFQLLDLLGTRHLVELQKALRVEFRDPGGKRTLLSAPSGLPSPLDVVIAMLRLGGLGIGERLALLRVGLAVRLGTPSSGETVRSYLDRLGQSRRLQDRLWDPIIIATLNTPPERASAVLFTEVMRRAFLGGGSSSHLAFPRAGLSHLIAPARDYIETAGGTVITGAAITALQQEAQGYIVRLKDRTAITAQQVISALPWRSLRPLLRGDIAADHPAPPADHEYIPIVSLYLWYDRALKDIPAFAALLGTSVQWMFNRRALGTAPNPQFPGLLSCTISTAFKESTTGEEEMVAIADRELRAAFPELQGARLLHGLAIKEKHATFAATPAAMLRPGTRTDIPGYYLAGDWTATGLPATIEGAVLSGFAAAQALLEDTGGPDTGKR